MMDVLLSDENIGDWEAVALMLGVWEEEIERAFQENESAEGLLALSGLRTRLAEAEEYERVHGYRSLYKADHPDAIEKERIMEELHQLRRRQGKLISE